MVSADLVTLNVNYGAVIDPQAVVRDSVLGYGTRVCQHSTVINAVLGEHCLVWPNVMLDGPIFGDRCKIASGVAMGPGFKIGDDCFIGPNVAFANDMWPSTDREGFDIATLRTGQKFCIIVEDQVAIGANVVVLPGVRIRQGAVVAAGAVVDKDVPAHTCFQRNGYISAIPETWKQRRMRYTK